MIVGGGIIARSLHGLTSESTLFASGVSNSSCEDPLEFRREMDLLLSQDRSTKLVYFSTCSLSDGSEHNEYLRHKLRMERLISEEFNEWLVLRLPTVVGHGGNSNNFFNFISNSLRRGEPVYVQRSLHRSLLDYQDIPTLAENLVDNLHNKTIDVCVDNSETVLQITQRMRLALGSISDLIIIDDKKNQQIDNCAIKRLVPETFQQVNVPDYNDRLIKKYLAI